MATAGIAYLEPLLGAIYDQDQSSVAPALHRFQAVISDLYRSFLSKVQRASLNIPLVEQLPPLATFAYNAGDGPFTLPSDDLQKICGSTVGVVSLPSSYRDHPVIWPALAHETGGHDVTHADVGLLPELQSGVKSAVGGGPMGDIWAYWMDEASADVYGLLNIGPTFVFDLAAFLTTVMHQSSLDHPPIGQLSNRSYCDEKGLDAHPTDLLRVHLALGVIDALPGLDMVVRAAYVKQVSDLAVSCAGAAADIEVATVDANGIVTIVQTYPLADMQTAAAKAGRYIATAQLQSLGGHSIQDIETWDDSDEAKATAIRDSLLAGQGVSNLGDDAQVLAGATLALLQDASRYLQVTPLVNSALDASFASDPIFGALRRDHMIQPARLRR